MYWILLWMLIKLIFVQLFGLDYGQIVQFKRCFSEVQGLELCSVAIYVDSYDTSISLHDKMMNTACRGDFPFSCTELALAVRMPSPNW